MIFRTTLKIEPASGLRRRVLFFGTSHSFQASVYREIKTDLDSGSANAMELKKRVAGIIVEEYHNTKSASSAREFFERTVQGREIPDDIPIYALPPQVITNTLRLSNLLQENGMTSSAGEARRLIDQGAVRLDDKTITQNVLVSELKPGVLRVGRRRYLRLV